jgi:transposase
MTAEEVVLTDMGGVGCSSLDIYQPAGDVEDMEWRDRRIAELERQLGERDARIKELEGQVAVLRAQVAELRAELQRNSTNSSKPPSSDPPGTKRATKKTRTGRRPGGQPGHQKHERQLLPLERVTRVIQVVPERCAKCSSRRVTRIQETNPERHQVIDLPLIQPDVTEYQCFEVGCRDCGERTRAPLPAEGHRLVGSRLGALMCLFMGKYRHSKRMTQSVCSDVLGVDVSLGMILKVGAEMSHALEASVNDACVYVREQREVNADETGWPEGVFERRKRRGWLWLFATRMVAVFYIALSRGGEVVRKALNGPEVNAPAYTGFLTTDRWSAYKWHDVGLRQLCWSHLTRDIQAFIDRGGDGERIGDALMKQRHKMFKWWHRVGNGTLSRADFEKRMRSVEREVGRLLREAATCSDRKVAATAEEILKLEQAMWTFVDVEGLEPTNNFAEQLLRHAVIWRKTSFGTQTSAGSRFVERILTAVTTLKLQKRNVLDFLTDALDAYRHGQPSPSLLPTAPEPRCVIAA